MTSSAQPSVIQSEPAPGLRLVTLNEPRLRNAMTAELTAEWTNVFDEIAADPGVRAVVITGAGSAFCSGADLSWLDQGSAGLATPDQLRERLLPFYKAWLAPRTLSVPVVAAVNGPAIGAGLALALACDVRYASTTATFRAPFILIGVHGGMAANWLLTQAVGISRAKEMLFTGRELDAEQAVSWGLVAGISDDVVASAIEAAAMIAKAGPIATRLTKASLNQMPTNFDAAVQWDALAQPLTMATTDIHEGILAIRERRAPSFDGR